MTGRSISLTDCETLVLRRVLLIIVDYMGNGHLFIYIFETSSFRLKSFAREQSNVIFSSSVNSVLLTRAFVNKLHN